MEFDSNLIELKVWIGVLLSIPLIIASLYVVSYCLERIVVRDRRASQCIIHLKRIRGNALFRYSLKIYS